MERCQTATIILVMATADDLCLVFIFILATDELRPNARAF